MERVFHYAILNEDSVCVEFEASPRLKANDSRRVKLDNYNETVLYKKWLGDQWSNETYEPSVPVALQEQLDSLQRIVEEQNISIGIMQQNESTLISTINQLEGTIMELTTLIALLQPQGGM